MKREVEIQRSKNGSNMAHFCALDLENEGTWPNELPKDIRDLLVDAREGDTAEVDNNRKNSTDGCYYRLPAKFS